jgi:ABC-type amino acid transport substrate-binding protein
MKTANRVLLWLISSLLLFSACMPAAFAAGTENHTKLQLSQAEQDFIAEHPVIRLGVDPTFVPFEFIDSDGTYKGIAADYIELICERTGLQMAAEPGLTWTEAYEKAVTKELDLLPCVANTPDRQKYFLFSNAYYRFQRAIFVSETNNSIKAFDDLHGQTVAVQANSSHSGFLPKLQRYRAQPLSKRGGGAGGRFRRDGSRLCRKSCDLDLSEPDKRDHQPEIFCHPRRLPR